MNEAGGHRTMGDAGDADTWWFQRRWSDFRRGSTDVSISWEGGAARARLFDDGAPQTAGGFAEALPLQVPFIHVAWSGEMIMATERYEFGPQEAENDVRLVRPGDLTWDPKCGELGVVYGTAECRLPSGPNCVTVFGSVSEGLEALAGFCRRRRFDGIGTLNFARASVGRPTEITGVRP